MCVCVVKMPICVFVWMMDRLTDRLLLWVLAPLPLQTWPAMPSVFFFSNFFLQ